MTIFEKKKWKFFKQKKRKNIVNCAAVIQSKTGYLLPEMTFPINITGITLHAFAKTWVGKETNFKASYWNQEDKIFDKKQNEYS